MICNTGRIYGKARVFTNMNKLIFRKDRVYKHYGSAKTRVMLSVASLFPTQMNLYLTPQERKAHEEATLKKLFSFGLPVPEVVDSGSDYIVMKRICGIPLPDLYSSNELSRRQKLNLMKHVGKLARKMHNTGVVHGDLAIRQFMLEPGGLHPEIEKTVASNDFKLYVIDFETMPKRGGAYGKSVDNILCTLSASSVGNLPYPSVKEAYEMGYGKKIETQFFSQDILLKLSLLGHVLLLTYRVPALHRYMDMHRALTSENQIPAKKAR